MDDKIPPEKLEIIEEGKRSLLSIIGQILRIIFYLGLLYLVWELIPFSFKEINYKEMLELAGAILASLSIIYSLLTPDPEDYDEWGWVLIWIMVGVAALYVVSFFI